MFFDHPEVREAQYLQRCLFERLQHSPQGFTESRAARDDVIVSAKDGALGNDLHRQPCEQACQPGAGINIDVRSQPVTQFTRQIVDERDIAEMVLSAPVDAWVSNP